MSITDEQKATIAKWIEAGATLSEIQKRLKEEFQISLTYLETRLLADDLKLAIKEPERQPEPPPIPAAEADTAEQRNTFGRMRAALTQLKTLAPACDTLSMGMSDDYELAIEEGATIVRVGSAIFGPRNR